MYAYTPYSHVDIETYTCGYTCIHTYSYIYAHLHTFIYISYAYIIYIYLYVYTYTQIYRSAYLHVYTCTHVSIYPYVSIYIYVYLCISMHAYIRTYIRTYTHIHTHMLIHMHMYTSSNPEAHVPPADASQMCTVAMCMQSCPEVLDPSLLPFRKGFQAEATQTSHQQAKDSYTQDRNIPVEMNAHRRVDRNRLTRGLPVWPFC